MIRILFLVAACMLMLFNILYFLQRSLEWSGRDELFTKHPRMRNMVYFYYILLLCFLAGYLFITIHWSLTGQYRLKENGILTQILFWGAAFVMISNQNLFVMLNTTERDRLDQISDLTMSLDAYIDSIPGGVHHCIMDPDLRVTYVSEGFTEITGYGMEEISSLYHGKYVELCYEEEDRKILIPVIRQILDELSAESVVYRIRHKDGHPIWISENMKSVRDNNGILHIYAVLTDITMEKNQADEDGLTGLLNKRAFYSKAEEYLLLHKEQSLGLYMIDLNRFKEINDNYGHLAGDETLKQVADYLRSALENRECLIGRVGGDEFMVLVKNLHTEEEMCSIGEYIREKTHIRCVTGLKEIDVSGCIGGVFASCEESLEEIYHRADQAMYMEKAGYHRR